MLNQSARSAYQAFDAFDDKEAIEDEGPDFSKSAFDIAESAYQIARFVSRDDGRERFANLYAAMWKAAAADDRRSNVDNESPGQSLRGAPEDAALVEQRMPFDDIVARPLEAYFLEWYQPLKRALLEADEGWEVWIRWYEDRFLTNEPDLELEFARATLSPEVWAQGISYANNQILELEISALRRRAKRNIRPPPETAEEARTDLIQSSDAVNQGLDQIDLRSPGIGHNNPPPDLTSIRDATAQLTAEAQSPSPDRRVIDRIRDTIETATKEVAKFIFKQAAGEFIKTKLNKAFLSFTSFWCSAWQASNIFAAGFLDKLYRG